MMAQSIWGITDEVMRNDGHNHRLENSSNRYKITQSSLPLSVFPVSEFHEMGIRAEILNGIYDEKFDSPIKIQDIVLPLLLDKYKEKFLIIAPSKFGKTTAGIFAALNNVLNYESKQAIILCKTCQSAKEVYTQVKDIGKYSSYITYRLAVRNCNFKNSKIHETIIVGTPEKIFSAVEELKSLNLRNVVSVMIDEADAMIGTKRCRESITNLCKDLPNSCQIIICSENKTESLNDFMKKYIAYPITCHFFSEQKDLSKLKQVFVVWNYSSDRLRVLEYMIREGYKRVIVFCETRHSVIDVASDLQDKYGITVSLFHGKLSDTQKDLYLDKFRQGLHKMLITTTNFNDKSIDISAVINYDDILDKKFKLNKDIYSKRMNFISEKQNGLIITMIDKRLENSAIDTKAYTVFSADNLPEHI